MIFHKVASPRVRALLVVLLMAAVATVFVAVVTRVYAPVYYRYVAPFVSRDITQISHAYLNISYCNDIDVAQKLDLYTPNSRPFGDTPLLIYVHGGGWRAGNKQNAITKLYAPETVAHGIAFATVGYRLTGTVPYPAQNDDVRCAVSYLVAHAKQYGYDTTKIGIMGDSAGGHLAAMESLNPTEVVDYRAVIMLYGVSDLWNQIANYHDRNAVKYLGEKTKQLADKASPYHANLKNAPPYLIIHGMGDTIVPANESASFAEALEQQGVSVTYLPVIGASHAFVGGDYHETFVRSRIMQFLLDHLY